VAKRANYGFVKRQKELQKQQKKQEKAEKKRLKADSTGADDQAATGNHDEDGASIGDAEGPGARDPE